MFDSERVTWRSHASFAGSTAQADAIEALRTAGSHPILRSFPQGAIVAFDHDLRYLSAGGLGLADVGLSREMLEGHTIFEVFPPEVASIIEPHYRTALAGCESTLDVPYEGRIYVQRLAPLRDAEGAIVAGMGYTQDATEARRSDQTQADSDERFRSAFEHAPIGKALVAMDGRYEQVNQAMCEITGYTRSQLLELSVADITYPDDLAADMAGMDRLLSGDTATYTIDKRYSTAAGEVVWVAKSASLVRRQDGSPLHFINQVQDITESRNLQQALIDERRRLRQAQAIGHVGSWEWDLTSFTLTWSDTLFELYGLEPAHEVDYLASLRCLHPDDLERVDAAVRRSIATSEPLHVRYRVNRADDGELRWLDSRGVALHEDGHLVRLAGAIADVTEQVLAEEEAGAESHAFQEAVISASPDIIFVYDLAARATIWTNRSLSAQLAYEPDDDEAMAGGDVIDRLLVEEDRAAFDAAVALEGKGADGHILLLNHRLRHADGTTRWFCRRTTPLHRDEQGRVTQVVGVLRDITEAIVAEEQLEHAALHDHLTGRPNRRLVADRLHQALNRSEREGEVVVLFCDLDGFKRVNDTYGHQAGDAVLIEAASRLVSATRTGDTVGRVGGDEFVIVCAVPRGQDSSALGETIARRIERVMSKPIAADGTEHRVSISTGICLAGQGDEVETVLRNADVAMYLAKSRGKNGHVVFEDALDADRLDRADTERRIMTALANDTVEAYYQPIVDPATGRLRRVEALLRVPDEAGQHLNTYQVVTVAEQVGVIAELDERVLQLACVQMASWRRQPGHENLVVHVNRSAADIARPGFYDRITNAIVSTNLDPRGLVLEITETVLLDADTRAIDDLRQLRADGIGIAIDDFGTGYASLRYLATLPISCIKVDQSFTAGLPHDPICSTILRTSINLAADLEMDCVIEGIETTEQRAALPDSPMLLAQGYLYARPRAAARKLSLFAAPGPAPTAADVPVLMP